MERNKRLKRIGVVIIIFTLLFGFFITASASSLLDDLPLTAFFFLTVERQLGVGA